jgi:hypothetical protein
MHEQHASMCKKEASLVDKLINAMSSILDLNNMDQEKFSWLKTNKCTSSMLDEII